MGAKPAQKPTRPLLLVDVDGVISLWGGRSAERPDGAWTLVDGTPHLLARDAARRLATFDDLFETIWCTGWEERANEHLPQHVGLGPFAHLAFDRTMGGARSLGHWKLAAIDATAGPDRPLVWVDDVFTAPCWSWAAGRSGSTLLVQTDPADGFSAAHAEVVSAWARTQDAR